MSSWIRTRLTYANVMATIAVFGVLAGGGAYAAQKVGSKQIKKNAIAKKHIRNGAVKPNKLDAAVRPLWAVVDVANIALPEPNLVRGRGAVSVAAAAGGWSGRVTVKFNRNIRGCAYTASPGLTGPGQGIIGGVGITVHSQTANADTLFVQTWDTDTGNTRFAPFHVQVAC